MDGEFGDGRSELGRAGGRTDGRPAAARGLGSGGGGESEKLSKREEAKEPIRHLAAAAALTQ